MNKLDLSEIKKKIELENKNSSSRKIKSIDKEDHSATIATKKDKSFVKCRFCGFKVKTIKQLKKHIKNNHGLECEFCKAKFSTSKELKQHRITQHSDKKNIKSQKENNTIEINIIIDDLCKSNKELELFVDKNIHNRIMSNIMYIKEKEIIEDLEEVVLLKGASEFEHKRDILSKYLDIRDLYSKIRKIDKTLSLKKLINIQCPYCKDLFFSESILLEHVKNKHKATLLEFLKKFKIQKSYCKYCDELILDSNFEKHYNVCSKTSCEYCNIKVYKDDYNEHLAKCLKYREKLWKQSSPIKDIIEENDILNNIKKHQADKYQFQEDDELDPSFINEEEYQKTFTTLLCDKIKDKKDLVVFEHEQIDTQEKEDKSEIKVFLSQMYKGYCQVCGFTFRKPNGINSFERFNWNDKRVVKVKKSFVSTADSLCLCRNCSANIKWGAFYPTFIDTIKQIENFKNKKYIDIREKIHKVVDKQIPEIFETLLEFDEIYALEIELDGKSRNIYFTNEHLLQFVTYLQKEDEVKTKVEILKRKQEIYHKHPWLNKEEEIPKELARQFIKNTVYWDHPKAYRYVPAPSHSDRIENNFLHGWSIKFGANYFLVGKAIKRCRRTINNYIENNTTISFDKLKDDLSKNIRGAVATGNNDEYSGYYPLEDGYMKFGVQAIDVDEGIEFLIKEVGLKTL